MIVFDWQVTVFDWQVTVFDWQVTVFDWKVTVFPRQVTVFPRQVTVFPRQETVFPRPAHSLLLLLQRPQLFVSFNCGDIRYSRSHLARCCQLLACFSELFNLITSAKISIYISEESVPLSQWLGNSWLS